MSAAQASKAQQAVWENAEVSEEEQQVVRKESFRETVRATCPNCDAPLATNAKFCPECGHKLGASVCSQCGAKLTPNAKFCPECGTKVS